MNSSSSRSLAGRVAAIYAFFGAMWILFSDQILAMLVGDTHTLTYIQTLKGCFYVSVTAVLVYLLVERGARTAHATLERRVEERTVQLRQYQERLEDLVRERTKQLEVEINERKLVQTERERLIGELEARNSELEQFAYTVSHDLKAPLITVTSYLGALREDLDGDDRPAVEDDLCRMARAADKMAQLLDELLELSRIGRLCNPPQQFPMGELVDEVLEVAQPQIDASRIRIVVAEDLPPLFGDRQRLVQVFQNLIDNAVKFVRKEEHPRIEIAGGVAGGEVICSIRDNGIGIDPRFHDRVFGLFEQLDPTVEGSGIGLALVKRIVEVHGGRVWIESEGQGRGCTVCLALPCQEGEAAGGAAS